MQNLKCKIKKIITSLGNYISYKFTFCNLIVRLCSLQAFAICNIINFSDITDKHYIVSVRNVRVLSRIFVFEANEVLKIKSLHL